MRFVLTTGCLIVLLSVPASLVAQPGKKEPPTAPFFVKEIERFDSLNAVEQYPSGSVLFTGSSSIVRWSTLKQDLFPYPVIQRGFGGSRIEDLDWYLERIIFPHELRAVVIMVGSNNLSGGPRDMSLDSILMYTHQINARLQARYPQLTLFWIAITPVPSRVAVLDRVLEMNRRWKTAFQSTPSIHFIDTGFYFLNEAGQPRGELFIADRLHLNPEGYRVWAGIIKRALDARLQ